LDDQRELQRNQAPQKRGSRRSLPSDQEIEVI
jgi:hypothetical protein